eukprot:1061325-Prymnesium_polylepis.1
MCARDGLGLSAGEPNVVPPPPRAARGEAPPRLPGAPLRAGVTAFAASIGGKRPPRGAADVCDAPPPPPRARKGHDAGLGGSRP